MADEYIRRAEALEITTRTCGDYAAAYAEIWKLPAADVAPVVRCKDCEYSYEDIDGLTCVYGPCVDCTVPEDFYCKYGGRKEE